MKNIPSSASIILHKPITILNEGYEHLIKNFEDISNMMNKLNEKLKADSSGLNSFSNINKNFMNLKDNFSKFYNNVYESLNVNLFKICLEIRRFFNKLQSGDDDSKQLIQFL